MGIRREAIQSIIEDMTLTMIRSDPLYQFSSSLKDGVLVFAALCVLYL